MPDTVQSFARGLAVVRALGAPGTGARLSDIAVHAGVPRATARRLLHTLVQEGYAWQDGDQFRPTPRMLELGATYLTATAVADLALPVLEQLAAEVREAASVAVLDGSDVVYVARVPARHRIMTVSIGLGTRFPATRTSLGQVLLADADEEVVAAALAAPDPFEATPTTIRDLPTLQSRLAAVREVGHALVDQELEVGLRSLAVPVRGRDGTVHAAMNVSTAADRRSAEDLRAELLPPLTAAAAALGRAFRASRWVTGVGPSPQSVTRSPASS